MFKCSRMSFRIDDILKKDSQQTNQSIDCYQVSDYNGKQVSSFNNKSIDDRSSILQKTLLRQRYQNQFFRYDKPSERTYSYQYQERTPPLYLTAVQPYQNYYTNKYCSINLSPAFLPLICPSYPQYSKRKGGQIRFTAKQTDILERKFLSHKYLTPEDRKVLADSLKLSDKQVKTWFQNRRAKWRRNSISSNTSSQYNNEDTRTDHDHISDRYLKL